MEQKRKRLTERRTSIKTGKKIVMTQIWNRRKTSKKTDKENAWKKIILCYRGYRVQK